MLSHEKEKYDQIDCTFGSKYWLPVKWALSIVRISRQEKLIDSDLYCERICEEIKNFRNNLANLCKFDWVPLPLAYPQLVYLAVYVHFFIILISKQEIIIHATLQNNATETSSTITLHRWFPLTSAIQFFFYMAWTKIAMVLINPFGEDDDDFELNKLIDRNFKVGMEIVDNTNDIPIQLKDSFWNRNIEALYSEETIRINKKQDEGLMGSATRYTEPCDNKHILMIPLKKNPINYTSNTIYPMFIRQRQRQTFADNDNSDISRGLPTKTARSITNVSTPEEYAIIENSGSLQNEQLCYVNQRYTTDAKVRDDPLKQQGKNAEELNVSRKLAISRYGQYERDTLNRSKSEENKDDDSFEQIEKM